jgi:hypothetical protein
LGRKSFLWADESIVNTGGIMATNIQGIMNKRKRQSRVDIEPVKHWQTLFFKKGVRRGVLAVYDNCYVWDVYADADFSQHVEWLDKDCNVKDFQPTHILGMISILRDKGFELYKEVLNDIS